MKNQLAKKEMPASELLALATYRISKVHSKLNAQAAYVLRKEAGLNLVQWRILAWLNAFGPKVPSADIINKVSMDKGLFSRSLKTLVSEEFIIAEADDLDQRRQLLSLSDKGNEIYGQVITIMRKRQKHLLHDVTDTEKAALFSALEKLELNAERRDF